MADPFEVRMKFSHQLQHLNASVTSAQKAAQYALRHRDMDEDLHSCILEQIERTNMNTRANIMYFIEHFLEMAQKDGHVDYIRMIQRDIIRVVDAVAPDDGSGAANVKVVLQGLQSKAFLPPQTVTEINEVLKERETSNMDVVMSSPVNSTNPGLGDMPPSQTIPKPGSTPRPPMPDKKQIEQRIEEDRERHKRLRESIWAVPTQPEDAEMWKMWEETSDLGEDDLIMAKEEEEERQRCIRDSCPHRREEAARERNGQTNGSHS
ncbi:hypothetical protein DHEL01_v200158 [Diaporthe helianthi]|uniref:CID domain-containing protein n=1 Tax=Diaporthe helianthi TaxID=158607 RepID=A0A2P5IG08_DIAHE|nr:hypothetical protein DHEL01_v200158 [Diaporthe helianthi]